MATSNATTPTIRCARFHLVRGRKNRAACLSYTVEMTHAQPTIVSSSSSGFHGETSQSESARKLEVAKPGVGMPAPVG